MGYTAFLSPRTLSSKLGSRYRPAAVRSGARPAIGLAGAGSGSTEPYAKGGNELAVRRYRSAHVDADMTVATYVFVHRAESPAA